MFSRVEDILTKNPTIPQSRVEDLLVQLMEGLPTDEHIRDLVGSPLKADTVSEMTDDTKIYIYTGSETGYTAGHWYYYNGSSWADGGVYNSAGINTDKTLSVEDKAADGKAVGDELTDLKSDLNQLEMGFGALSLPVTGSDHYIALNGDTANVSSPVTTQTPYKYYVVSCVSGDKFTVNATGGGAPRAWAFLSVPNSSGVSTVLSRADADAVCENLVLTAPSGAYYLVINDKSDRTSYYGERITSLVTQNRADIDDLQTDISEMEIDISDVETELEEIKEITTGLEQGLGIEPLTITGTDHYITTSGDTANVSSPVDTQSGYNYYVVRCEEGDTFTINATGGGSPRAWAFLGEPNSSGVSTVLSKAEANAVCENLILTAPTDAYYLVINDKSDKSSYRGEQLNTLVKQNQTNISVVGSDVEKIKKITDVTEYSATVVSYDIKTINSDGSIATGYAYQGISFPIPLNAGESIEYALRANNASVLVLCAYDANGTKLEGVSGGSSESDIISGVYTATQNCIVRISSRYDLTDGFKCVTYKGYKDYHMINVIDHIAFQSTYVRNSDGIYKQSDTANTSERIKVYKGQTIDYSIVVNATAGRALALYEAKDSTAPYYSILGGGSTTNLYGKYIVPKDSYLQVSCSKIFNGYCYILNEGEIRPDRDVFNSSVDEFSANLSKNAGTKIGFITDVHFSNDNFRNTNRYFSKGLEHVKTIVRSSKNTLYDLIINGGDNIWDNQAIFATCEYLFDVNRAFDGTRADVITLAGNHDFNDTYYNGLATKDETQYLTDVQLANIYHQKSLYGYVDIGNIRCIYLNTSDALVMDNNAKKYNRASKFAIKNAQLQWLADTLASTPSGMHVIVFSHAAMGSAVNGSYVPKLLEKFLDHASGTYQDTADSDFPVDVSYNFTSNSNNAVICLANGHTHMDALDTVGDAAFVHISTTTASMFEEGSLTRVYGEASETVFDCFCIDTANRSVTVKRYGAGTDRTFTY